MKRTQQQNKELELILNFLGINFIDYQNKRISNGHRIAKTLGEIKSYFGREVMTTGQFIDDIDWWDFENNWNDLIFLINIIKNKHQNTQQIDFYLTACNLKNTYSAVINFLKENFNK